ncbi:MAG: FG-GAP repeat protein [Myxococcota bacterium]|nr:FG-GAP repeat protein [Myxococcota bacterium]
MVAIVGVLIPARASLASVPEETALMVSDGAADDLFGLAVAIDGDTTLVGGVGADGNSVDCGAAYVFRYDGTAWIEGPKLIASDGAVGDYFGISVAVDGDTALVGAGRHDGIGTDSGAAYVFRYDGTAWVEEAKLTSSDSAGDDYFGYWVAIDGDTALVGAVGSNGNVIDSGAAYVFRYDGLGWAQEAKLTAFDGTDGDFFGRSVALNGDTAVIGAGRDDDKGTNSGAAYVFRNNGTTWVPTTKLTASDGADFDAFGMSVAIEADTVVIGAFGDDDMGGGSGSAYVFRYDGTTWVEEKKLLAFDGTEFDNFGMSVAIAGDTVAVGAIGDDDNALDSGSAYVFHYSGTHWVAGEKLAASDAATDDALGVSVAITNATLGDMAVVGAWQDDSNGINAGAALVFMAPAVPALPSISIALLALGLLCTGVLVLRRGFASQAS